MQPAERSAQARREIDRRFHNVDLAPVRPRPHSGWLRAVRGALGMSQEALGRRLGISRASVAKLEKAELGGGITIAKLSQVAAELDCTLVYALVPKTSLEETVRRQAHLVAVERLGYVATTMELEDQALSADRRDEFVETYARDLVARNDLWRTTT